MKIACVSSTFPTPLRFWRGTFVQNFCLELERLGAEVIGVVPEGLHVVIEQKVREVCFPGSLKKTRVDTMLAPYLSFSILSAKNRYLAAVNKLSCRRSLERQLDKIKPKPDLVYAHFIMGGLLVLDWCKRNKVKLAVISGESSYEQFLRYEDPGKLSATIGKFDHLFFVSKRNQEQVLGYLGIGKPLGSVLGNAVNCENFRPLDKLQCRRELGLPTDALLTVFVGYFIDRKGPMRVSEAIRGLPDVYGVFIGIGGSAPKGERVLHAGPVENSVMAMWLSAADIFVLPSYQEGRSNAVLEALACGLPLVVSDRDFNREFLTEDCAIFVEPGSVDAIADAISRLGESMELRARMGRASREQAMKFSQAARARRFLDVVRVQEPAGKG